LQVIVKYTVSGRRGGFNFRRKINVPHQAPASNPQDSVLKNFAIILTLSALLASGSVAQAAPDTPTNTDDLPLIQLSEDLMLKYLSAELAFQRGQAAGAHLAMMALARSSGDPRLARRATEIAIAASSAPDALKGAKLWRELAPRSDEALQVLLSLQLNNNRLDEAKQALAQLLAASTPDLLPTAINTVQRNLARMSDKSKAAGLMRELLEPYRESVDARLAIAQFSMVSGDRAGALREARDAVKKFPKSEIATLVLAQIVEDKPEAARVLNEFLQKNPKAREVRLAYARMFYEQSKIPEAKKEFKILIEQKKDDQTALFALGLLSVQANELPDAEKYLSAYINTLGGQPDRERDATQALMVLAQIAEDRNDLAGALKWLEMGDTLTYQGSVTAKLKRAQLQSKNGKVDAGRQLLAETDVDSDDDRVRLIIADAQILRDANRLPEAIKVLEDALDSLPDNIDLLYEYAMLVEKNREFDAMEKALRRMIQIAPSNPQSYNALGYSFAERNLRLPEAYDLINIALTLAPDDAFIMDSMGWVEFRMGRLEKAEETLRRAYALRADPEIAVHLGEVLWLLGREDEAKKLWRFANGKDPKNETLKGTLARFQVKL
jgi:tetratricopeptide (TPR) repeat protein